MDQLFAIVWKLLGEACKMFCNMLPSRVALSCRQSELTIQHLVLKFYLQNESTTPMRDYAMTIHLPGDLARHLRDRALNYDSRPATLCFSGPLIYNWTQGSTPLSSIGHQTNAAEYPLLPAGPPIPVGELDFWISEDPPGIISKLQSHPIKIEFWGASGMKHEVVLYLREGLDSFMFVESKKSFKISTSSSKLLSFDVSRR